MGEGWGVATLPSVVPLSPSLKMSGPKRMSSCMKARISWSSDGALLEANLPCVRGRARGQAAVGYRWGWGSG